MAYQCESTRHSMKLGKVACGEKRNEFIKTDLKLTGVRTRGQGYLCSLCKKKSYRGKKLLNTYKDDKEHRRKLQYDYGWRSTRHYRRNMKAYPEKLSSPKWIQREMWVLAVTGTVSVSRRTTFLTLICGLIGGNCEPTDQRSRMSLWHGNITFIQRRMWY